MAIAVSVKTRASKRNRGAWRLPKRSTVRGCPFVFGVLLRDTLLARLHNRTLAGTPRISPAEIRPCDAAGGPGSLPPLPALRRRYRHRPFQWHESCASFLFRRFPCPNRVGRGLQPEWPKERVFSPVGLLFWGELQQFGGHPGPKLTAIQTVLAVHLQGHKEASNPVKTLSCQGTSHFVQSVACPRPPPKIFMERKWREPSHPRRRYIYP